MKRLLFILLPLLIALPIFANEVVTEEKEDGVPSFSIENEDVVKFQTEDNAGETKEFDVDAFKQKKKITDGLLFGSITASSVGVSILVTSIIMGFIPKDSFPQSMFEDVAFEIIYRNSKGEDIVSSYPSMMVYCCVGSVLFCVGTLILLFALPIMFYSIVRKVNERKLEKAMKKEEPHWEVSASGFQFRF